MTSEFSKREGAPSGAIGSAQNDKPSTKCGRLQIREGGYYLDTKKRVVRIGRAELAHSWFYPASNGVNYGSSGTIYGHWGESEFNLISECNADGSAIEPLTAALHTQELQLKVGQLETENADLKAQLEALQPKPTSTWQNVYADAEEYQDYDGHPEVESREKAGWIASKTAKRIAVLRRDTINGVTTAHLEEI